MFLNNLFHRSQLSKFISPMSGKVIKMEEVPDPAFSQKMMGEGCAIILSDGKIVAPVDGEINVAFPTGHAYGIVDKNGIEILIHVGIDTVELEGDGFTTYVNVGDKVKAGDLLAEVDIKKIEEFGKSLISPIAIVDKDKIEVLAMGEEVIAGDTLLMLY